VKFAGDAMLVVDFGVFEPGINLMQPHTGKLWVVCHGAAACKPRGTPRVDQLQAVVLPPGAVPGVSGVWLRVRLSDPGDAGPWDWTIDWGDRVDRPKGVDRTGQFVFLRSTSFGSSGPHTITVTATDPGGLTSAPAAVTVIAP